MSGSLHPFDPGQASSGRGQLGQQASKRAAAFRELDRTIPKDEHQWREARQMQRFETPEDVYRTVSSLIRDNQDALLHEDLRRLVAIADCCVESRKDETKAYRKYRSRFGYGLADNIRPTDYTIRNYMSLVRGLVTLIDQVYPRLRHRAFEAVLYAPLNLPALGYYKQEPDQFKSCFRRSKIVPEVQASLTPNLAFIVAIRHPELPYKAVCEALNTKVLGEEEHLRFVSVFQSQRPIPYMLLDPASLDNKSRYDTARDQWRFVTVPDLVGYELFAIPESIQQTIATAGKQQDDCVRQEVPGAAVVRFKWSRDHEEAVSQVVSELRIDRAF
ncbi:hypothetical protein CEP52_014838 [Fusarium oligoseptatum]|uniref:Uncharacterized protein n=1 Tax=Fusarium oligoseptatum TaxID=2604345 RepID=A0A428SIN5_9HYPO|nr:hypothetical protein CEP52_014838 [Fusarium oligoseptatum]